jgi:outer membrane receptor for ferrienterochelin and colicins
MANDRMSTVAAVRQLGRRREVERLSALAGLLVAIAPLRLVAQTDAGAPEVAPMFGDAGHEVPSPHGQINEAPAAAPALPALPLRSEPAAQAPEAVAEVTEVLSALDGQDLSALDLEALLENVVVAATKSQVKEDLAPAITTVIGREEIQRWGYRSVEEVLHHVAGVYVIDDHILPNLAVRGISGGLRSESGLVKVMIDGHSVAFRSTAGNWLGPELVPMSIVQQIEVIRGPASALYGADAFLGVINIVTRRPAQMQGGEVSLVGDRQGGSTWGYDMAVGAGTDDWQFMAAVRTGGENRSGLTLPRSSPAPKLPDYAPADLAARDLRLDSTVALSRATLALGKRGAIGMTGYLSQIDRNAEFADWQQLTHNLDSNGRQNGTNISLRQASLGADLVFALSPTIDLATSAYFFDGGPTSHDRIELGSDLFYVKRDFGYRGGEATVEATWRPNERVTLLLGSGVILDYEKLPTVYDVLKSSIGTGAGERAGDQIAAMAVAGSKYMSSHGLNAMVVWTAMPWLTVTGGARYDYHSVYGSKPSGRLAGVVELRRNLHLKLLYGSAFKAPSPQLLYGSPLAPGDIAGNDQLKPSYVHTVESQLAYRPTRLLLFATGVAYSYLLDQAAFAQRGINQVALNISRVGSVSWESEARFDYRRKVTAYANVALNHTVQSLRDPSYLATLSNYSNPAYPKLVANGGLSGDLPRLPLRASAELSYISARRSSTANSLDAGGMYELPGYTLLGIDLRTVGLHLLPKKETLLRFGIRNVADTRYAAPGFAGVDYPQLGRTFYLMATQEF